MYKALLVALIGLFFSSTLYAEIKWNSNQGTTMYTANDLSDPATRSALCPTGVADFQLAQYAFCYGSPLKWYFGGSFSCAQIPSGEKPPSCREDTQNFCPDGSIAPNGDFAACPEYTCADGEIVEDPYNCSTPFQCPDGSAPPNNSVPNCPINCDILSGGGGPDCDTEEPNEYCSENQSPVFDNCTYGPDDPRNPINQPDPNEHCQQFPDSVSCSTDLPDLTETDFCKAYPNALSCQTPEVPDLDSGTPPPGGIGTGIDNSTPLPPPPAPPPINSGSPTSSTDARLDNLRYDISKLHSGLNYQTSIIATGLTGVAKQLQANGGKIDRSNTLLDGINKNLDVLNGGLKGDPLTSGNFDVEGGINSALGITGDEKISDLVQEPVKLSDYTQQYEQFLSDQNLSCSNALPTIEFSVMGKQYSFDINYQPACDWLANLGNFLLFITWIGLPAIIFGRRS